MRWIKYIFIVFLSLSCTEETNPLAPVPDTPVTDIDGNTYQTVRIGNQVWMAENLHVTHYNDGTPISLDTAKLTWTNAKTEKFCYYANTTDPDSIAKFGALYNWHAVNTGKLAPTGWHVPTPEEWDALLNHMIANGYNYDGTTTGNKIGKSLAARDDWEPSTNTGAIGNDLSQNNVSGFSAYPSGFRTTDGRFFDIGKMVTFWTTAESDNYNAWHRQLTNSNGYLLSGNFYKSEGRCVRCVRD